MEARRLRYLLPYNKNAVRNIEVISAAAAAVAATITTTTNSANQFKEMEIELFREENNKFSSKIQEVKKKKKNTGKRNESGIKE